MTDPFEDLADVEPELDDALLETLFEIEPETQASEGILRSRIGKLRHALERFRDRVVYALNWLRRPDEVGRPVTIQPRGIRSLLFLVLGNLLVLALLTVGLYQASTSPLIVESALPAPIIITASPSPSSATSLSPSPEPTPAGFGSEGAIAFTLRRNGNADIYALNQADRQLVRLTYDVAEDRDPAWSPDGNYIAFTSNRAQNWDIYLLDLLTGALIRLTHSPAFDANPAWSPDGKYIAFETYRRGNLDIYVMSTTGEQVRLITVDLAPNYEPTWSPDSRAIAYTTFRDGTKDLYVQPIDEDGERVNITQSPDLDEHHPAWSPDGTQLAYVSGPQGNPSIQVTTFDWDSMTADETQTELFGAGNSPVWASDGQNLLYTYRRGTRSQIVAASMTGWGLFHDVYSLEEPLDDLAWTSLALSPRIIARAQADAPATEPSFYVEIAQPTPIAGPPYDLVSIPGVRDADADDREHDAVLSDRVNESFSALRQRVVKEAGWDYLANLGTTQLPMTYTPHTGQSRMSWYVCGRAIGLDQKPYTRTLSSIELVREDEGNVTYWRVFIRAAEQDGSMGEPLREGVWDLYARQDEGRALVEGGELKERIPSGYYVDFTTLAGDYGWERLPALWRWRYFWPDICWWRFRKTDGLSWWECMLEVFAPRDIEASFGPIPGLEEESSVVGRERR
jgi:WD40 repeat protein